MFKTGDLTKLRESDEIPIATFEEKVSTFYQITPNLLTGSGLPSSAFLYFCSANSVFTLGTGFISALLTS